MRNALLVVALVTSLAACGGKKKVANPSNSGAGQTTEAPGSGSNDEQNTNKPADPNDPAAKSSDPCEGGE